MPTGGGGGGGGLSIVSVTARLTGNGTGGSPLDIAGWPEIFYTVTRNLDQDQGFGNANQTVANGFTLPNPLTFATIAVEVHTADAAGNYDFGVYTKAGALVANIGATHLPSTGLVSFSTLQGSQTIAPGLYIFAGTGNAVTAKIWGNTHIYTWFQNGNIGATVGGVLNSSVTAQSVSPATSGFNFLLY